MVLDPQAVLGDELDPEIEEFLNAFMQGLGTDSRTIDEEDVQVAVSEFNRMRVCAGIVESYYEGQLIPVGIQDGRILWRKIEE